MAISGFGRGKGGETTTVGGAAPAPGASGRSASSTSMGGLTAFIDQGSEFEGKLSFKDTVRIDGSFRGEITSENTLIVGESGEIEANIKSTVVVVSGTVTGDIQAGRQIVLHKTARVEGDLETPSVMVEEGAVFNGRLSMKGGSAAQSSTKSLKSVPTGGEKASSSNSGNSSNSGSDSGAGKDKE